MRPQRRPGTREFFVCDEAVLVRPDNLDLFADEVGPNRAISLNRSSRAIWELCDGSRSIDDIVASLESRFATKHDLLKSQVQNVIARMAKLGFIEGIDESARVRGATTFVVGIEDKQYLRWQTAIFLESLMGKLPAGWRICVVVCNDHEPMSEELRNIIDAYGVIFAHGTNYAKTSVLDVGWENASCYSALNRVEALSVAAEHVEDDEIICLLDSDTFIYGDLNLDIMPKRCAAPRNWHIESEPFFSSAKGNAKRGVDLRKLLETVGCDATYKPGGVNVFLTGEVAKNRKYIADCFRFAQSIFLLGRIAGATNTWMAEMPCFTLAMTTNGISWDLLERQEFLVSSCKEQEIPEGTIYHYYCDPNDFGGSAFFRSTWHKQAYRYEDFLRTDFSQYAANATTDHERYFFQLAESARERLYA